MKFALVALVLLAAVACELAVARSHSNSLAWRQFKQQHGKVYATQEEEARRFAIFMANKQSVERHNANAFASFKMGLNHMSDWTPEEYARLNGFRGAESRQLDVISDEELNQILGSARDDPVPDEVDWRKVEGRVSPVKNQGHCGSCWAFATTGMLEGQELPRNMSSLVPLSEQQLVDCSKWNGGCGGGLVSFALEDLADMGGIESEADYPYEHVNQKCRSDKSKFVPLKIAGSESLDSSEGAIRSVVGTYGPVAVAFEATQEFMSYKSGIYEDHKCGISANHAVLIVGWGTDPKQGDYWIIKNSWGADWGEEGYFRFKFGLNMCGIAWNAKIATFN